MGLLVQLGRRLCPGLCLLTLCGCEGPGGRADAPGSAAQSFEIYVVNEPLRSFAERIAWPGARVSFPAPPEEDPAYWRPSVQLVQEYQKADLILLNGAGYASWIQTSSLPRRKLVVTAEGCREDFLRAEQGEAHQHGLDGDQAHGDLALGTWLDLKLATCQAARVRDALAAHRPEQRTRLDARFATLQGELLQLDARLERAAQRWADAPILASHPVYGYLADRYGLSIVSLHLEPDQALSDEDWNALDEARVQAPGSWMLWEAQPLQSTVRGLRERGLEALIFEPGARSPSERDFLSIMHGNTERLECATGVTSCR